MNRYILYFIVFFCHINCFGQSGFQIGIKTGIDYLPVKNEPNIFDIKLNASLPVKAGIFVRKDFDFAELQLGVNYARYNQTTSYNINYKDLHFLYDKIEKDHFFELEFIASKPISEKFSPFLGLGTIYQRNPGLFGEGWYGEERIFFQEINNDKKFNLFVITGLRYKIQTNFMLIEPALGVGYTFSNRDERSINFYDNTSVKAHHRKLYYSFGTSFIF